MHPVSVDGEQNPDLSKVRIIDVGNIKVEMEKAVDFTKAEKPESDKIMVDAHKRLEDEIVRLLTLVPDSKVFVIGGTDDLTIAALRGLDKVSGKE